MAIQSLFGPSVADVQELRRRQAEQEIAGAGKSSVYLLLYIRQVSGLVVKQPEALIP